MIGFWRQEVGRSLAISCLAMLPLGSGTVSAQQRPAAPNNAGPFQIEKFSGWTAAYTGQGRNKICYALGEPKERLPKGLKRDPASLFVSTRVGDGAKNEIAIRLGFGSKPREDGVLTVGATNFPLVTEGENAFLKNPAQEAQLLEALRKGQTFTVKVTSARGNALTDRYELRGFAQAVDRMARECP
jgi:invasion protein IalB